MSYRVLSATIKGHSGRKGRVTDLPTLVCCSEVGKLSGSLVRNWGKGAAQIGRTDSRFNRVVDVFKQQSLIRRAFNGISRTVEMDGLHGCVEFGYRIRVE